MTLRRGTHTAGAPSFMGDGTTMEILRVFNNNVILARELGGPEVVLTGRGVGYQKQAGDLVDPDKVARKFVPAGDVDSGGFAALVAELPPEHLALADEALAVVDGRIKDNVGSSLLIAIADHLSFAIKRRRQGIEMEFPLRAEVAHLYPEELSAAQAMLAQINRQLDEPLPDDEAVALAMHLVNAGFATGNLAPTYQMTEVLRQVFDIVDQSVGQAFDRQGVNAARFIAHLRYFFVRVHDGAQIDENREGIQQAISSAYPDAYQTAIHIKAMLELRLGVNVTDDELTYLTMHVARLADGPARGR
ncbi:MAG: PRD domain-containing protein [Propioniciclava sp.]